VHAPVLALHVPTFWHPVGVHVPAV